MVLRTLLTWPPRKTRATMARIAMRARMSAYSARPWPCWSRRIETCAQPLNLMTPRYAELRNPLVLSRMLEAQLWPAARANATAAASATTAGERATNAFTVSLLCLVRDRPGNRAFSLPAGVVIEIPGLASPSRGEFAPGESESGGPGPSTQYTAVSQE